MAGEEARGRVRSAAVASRPVIDMEAQRIMAVLLDSASLGDAARAAKLGFVGGLTTNPALMARETRDPMHHFARLLEAFPGGPACFQPSRDDLEVAVEEGRAVWAVAPERVVVKLPATADGVRAAATLTGEGIRCALTAVYGPAQALLAHETGCVWIIPYVDRAARHSAGGVGVVDALAAILARLQSSTRILAASLKSPQQVVDSILHGAQDVTAPLAVLESLTEHALTAAAVKEFQAAAALQ